MSRAKAIIKNGALLSLVAVLMRTIGVAFNAYIKDKLGEGGMGLVSLTMSVYGFAVTFATSGIALSVTRLVAESIGRAQPKDASRILRAAVGYALFFGLCAGLGLFLLSDVIARHLLCDLRTRASLRLLSISLLPIALSSVFSGYFVAVRRVSHNAFTQLLEQGVRIFLTITLLGAFLPKGLEYACLAIVGGSSLAELLSFFILLLLYLRDRRHHLPFSHEGEGGAVRRVCAVALPTAGAAWCRSGLLTAEHLLIPLCLAMGSFSRDEALASYAMIHGMALPIILWPTAILSSFAGLLVPEMAESRSAGKEKRIERAFLCAFSGALFFSCACAAVLSGCAEGLGEAIYHSEEVGVYIRVLAPLIPVMYLDSVVDAFLKGLGKQVYCMGVNIADAALAVLLVRLLLPSMGARGYLLVIVFTELFNFTLSAGRLLTLVRPQKKLLGAILLCPLSAAISSCVTLCLPSGRSALSDTLLGAFCILSLYLLLLLLFSPLAKRLFRKEAFKKG